MKMAKANENDLQMAMDLCGAFEALTQRWSPCMPEAIQNCGPEDCEHFDHDNDEQCGRALRHLLDIANRGSLMRLVWGMAVLLDPSNKMVDPDADTLEHHPERLAATPAPPGAEWQPIESAPKDGTQVLLYEPRDDEHQYETGFFENGDWYGPMHIYTIYPTHWKPLSPPDQTSSTTEAERLAVEIADDAAAEMIDSECVLVEGGWWDTSRYDCHDPEAEVRYLDLRGLLEHHPDRPEWVRMKDTRPEEGGSDA